MTHWIIYEARQNSSGFALYESSTELLKPELRARIHEFCAQVNSEDNGNEAVNLRYAPLGGVYILSVIFRKPRGYQNSIRSTHRIVNFIMDETDVDLVFRNPFSQIGTWLIGQAERILNDPKNYRFPGWGGQSAESFPGEKVPGNWVSPATLLGAASYCADGEDLSDQAFIGLPADCSREQPLIEIEKLMSLLPVELRRTVSFQTWMWSSVETDGIALNIGSADRIKTLRQFGFKGGPGTTKHIYYAGTSNGETDNPDSQTNHLFENLDGFVDNTAYAHWVLGVMGSWDKFLALNEVLYHRGPKSVIFEILDEKVWVKALKKKIQSPSVLKALKKECPAKQYKVLHKEIDEQLKYYAAVRAAEPQPVGKNVDEGQRILDQMYDNSDWQPKAMKPPAPAVGYNESVDGCQERNSEPPASRRSPNGNTKKPTGNTRKPAKKKRSKFLKGRKLNAKRLLPYAYLLAGCAGIGLVLWMLWSGLKQLVDVGIAQGDTKLSITISLADGIGLLRIILAFLLGVLTTLLVSYLIKVIRKLFGGK